MLNNAPDDEWSMAGTVENLNKRIRCRFQSIYIEKRKNRDKNAVKLTVWPYHFDGKSLKLHLLICWVIEMWTEANLCNVSVVGARSTVSFNKHDISRLRRANC